MKQVRRFPSLRLRHQFGLPLLPSPQVLHLLLLLLHVITHDDEVGIDKCLASLLHFYQSVVLLVLKLLLSIEAVVDHVFFECRGRRAPLHVSTPQEFWAQPYIFESLLVFDVIVQELVPATLEYGASFDLVLDFTFLNIFDHRLGRRVSLFALSHCCS